MKAFVKETGEKIDVLAKRNDDGSIDYFYKNDTFDNRVYEASELSFVSEESFKISDQPIDWNDKLIEFSGQAMQGLISGARYYSYRTEYGIRSYSYLSSEKVASISIGIAKEMVKQLKEELSKDG